jgi:hypothetical protein
MKPDPEKMTAALQDAMEAMAPLIAQHGATLGLTAMASTLGLLVVGCHRLHATGCPLAEAVSLLSKRFGDSVGQALSVSVDMGGHPGGRA